MSDIRVIKSVDSYQLKVINMRKKKPTLEQRQRKIEREVINLQKQIARIKIVLKDAHLMSLDD